MKVPPMMATTTNDERKDFMMKNSYFCHTKKEKPPAIDMESSTAQAQIDSLFHCHPIDDDYIGERHVKRLQKSVLGCG